MGDLGPPRCGDGIGLGMSRTALTSALLPCDRGSSRTHRCRRRLYVALNVEWAPFSMTSVTTVGYCWRSSCALADGVDDEDGFGDWLPSCGDDEVDPVCELNSTRNLADLAGPTDDDSASRCGESVSSTIDWGTSSRRGTHLGAR